jgi:sulfite reductase (ferredoxin)
MTRPATRSLATRSTSAGDDNDFGRKLRGHKVKADGMPEYVARVTRHYLDNRTQGESFAAWAVRAEEELLR